MKGFNTVSFSAALLAGVSSSAFAAAESAEVGAESAAASAATAEAADQAIIVTGQRSEYGARDTSTATKTNTNIRNIPQALTVISEKQI